MSDDKNINHLFSFGDDTIQYSGLDSRNVELSSSALRLRDHNTEAMAREVNMIQSRAMDEIYRVKVGSRGSAKEWPPIVMPINPVSMDEFDRLFPNPSPFGFQIEGVCQAPALDLGDVDFGEPCAYKPLSHVKKRPDLMRLLLGQGILWPLKLSLSHWTEDPFKPVFDPQKANDFSPLNIEVTR